MSRLPEDLRLALESLRLLNEKFISPLSRLDQLLRVCVESHERIADGESRFKTVQQDIEQSQQRGLQQEERLRAKLKGLEEQLSTIQAKYADEQQTHELKRIANQQQLEQFEADCAARKRELGKLSEAFQEETKRLEELRDRIRRAQTMEP